MAGENGTNGETTGIPPGRWSRDNYPDPRLNVLGPMGYRWDVQVPYPGAPFEETRRVLTKNGAVVAEIGADGYIHFTTAPSPNLLGALGVGQADIYYVGNNPFKGMPGEPIDPKTGERIQDQAEAERIKAEQAKQEQLRTLLTTQDQLWQRSMGALQKLGTADEIDIARRHRAQTMERLGQLGRRGLGSTTAVDTLMRGREGELDLQLGLARQRKVMDAIGTDVGITGGRQGIVERVTHESPDRALILNMLYNLGAQSGAGQYKAR